MIDIRELQGLSPEFQELSAKLFGLHDKKEEVVKIIYNDPATIVFFADGTKEVVKCHKDEDFSEEIGVAMAIANKVFGSRHQFLKTVNKFIEDKGDVLRVGDTVRVVSLGEQYPTYSELFHITGRDSLEALFTKGQDVQKGHEYTVVDIVDEPDVKGSKIAMIYDDEGVYLVNIQGIEKVS